MDICKQHNIRTYSSDVGSGFVQARVWNKTKPVKTVTDEKHTVLLYLCNVTLRTNTRRCLRSNEKRLCEVQYGAAQRPKLTARGCRGLQHIGAPLNTHDDRHRPHRRVRG